MLQVWREWRKLAYKHQLDTIQLAKSIGFLPGGARRETEKGRGGDFILPLTRVKGEGGASRRDEVERVEEASREEKEEGDGDDGICECKHLLLKWENKKVLLLPSNYHLFF